MTKTVVPVKLENFDKLPNMARVPIGIVCALWAVGPATVWRRVNDGILPSPIKEGGATRWVVQDLRAALAKRY